MPNAEIRFSIESNSDDLRNINEIKTILSQDDEAFFSFEFVPIDEENNPLCLVLSAASSDDEDTQDIYYLLNTSDFIGEYDDFNIKAWNSRVRFLIENKIITEENYNSILYEAINDDVIDEDWYRLLELVPEPTFLSSEPIEVTPGKLELEPEAETDYTEFIEELVKAGVFHPRIADFNLRNEAVTPEQIISSLQRIAYERDQNGSTKFQGQLEAHWSEIFGNYLVVHIPGLGNDDHFYRIASLEMDPKTTQKFSSMLMDIGLVTKDEADILVSYFSNTRYFKDQVAGNILTDFEDQKSPITKKSYFPFLEGLSENEREEKIYEIIDAVMRNGANAQAEWEFAQDDGNHVITVRLTTSYKPAILTSGDAGNNGNQETIELIKFPYPLASNDPEVDMIQPQASYMDEIFYDLLVRLKAIGFISQNDEKNFQDIYDSLFYDKGNNVYYLEGQRREFEKRGIPLVNGSNLVKFEYRPDDGKKWSYTLHEAKFLEKGYEPPLKVGNLYNGKVIMAVNLPDFISNSVTGRWLAALNVGELAFGQIIRKLKAANMALADDAARLNRENPFKFRSFQLVRFQDTGKLGVALIMDPKTYNALQRQFRNQICLLFEQAVLEYATYLKDLMTE